ncbi:MAG TPA: hypothetical protein VIX73_23115 [Kofleriaceae bacterium]|jgi:hypothetical protein
MSIRALIGALGKAGTGKSTKIRELAAPCRRLFVADPEGTWEQPVDVVVESAPAMFDALRQLHAYDPKQPFKLLYRDSFDRMRWATGLAVFAIGHCTLLIDELVWVCTAQYAPPPLLRLVQEGRKKRINILYTTREPQEIHNMFLSQANRLYFYRIERGNGLTRVKRDWPDLAAKLPTLCEYPGPRHPAEFCTYGNPAIENLLGVEGLDFDPERILNSARRKLRRDA